MKPTGLLLFQLDTSLVLTLRTAWITGLMAIREQVIHGGIRMRRPGHWASFQTHLELSFCDCHRLH